MAEYSVNIIKYFEFLVILAVVFYVSFQKSAPKINLAVGIFSAPQNFQQRDALRKTWLKLAPGETSKYFFVLGKTMCPVHPHDRLDVYGCEERRFFRSSEVLSSLPSIPKTSRHNPAEGFGFVADYKIQVTHIGLPDCYQHNGSVTIELKDGFDGTVIAKVSFSARDVEPKAIAPVIFPRYSEGLLVASGPSYQHGGRNCCPVMTKKTHGAVTFGRFLKNGRFLPVCDGGTSVCPFIMYKVLETNTSGDMERRRRSWQSTIQNTYQDINEETAKFQDIVLVNVTDVYRNLPKKLAKFIKHVTDEREIDFDFLMKTDDDSFIDLRRVLAELSDPWVQTSELWWWSTFMEYWRVPHEGKWREDHYRSATYPPFPCGGGYIINRATANYLSANEHQLKYFQGEDVSIGIWLSGMNVQKHNEDELVDRAVTFKSAVLGFCEDRCVWTCSNVTQTAPRCNLVQLTVPEMYSTWREYKKNTFL